MGYLGPRPFDTDEAADWLASLQGKVTAAKLSKPLAKYKKFEAGGPGADEVLSAEQMERIVQGQIQFWRQYPPKDWATEASTLDEWLVREERKKREFYFSGAYLDREYGPVEEALAAAGLIAALSNTSEVPPENVVQLVRQNTGIRLPPTLIAQAIAVVASILENDKYRRMRKKYLDAFPEVTGGDDGMAAVSTLLQRLREAE